MTHGPRLYLCTLLLAAWPHALLAQAGQDIPPGPDPVEVRQVLSANPFGLVFGLFNAEFERTVSRAATAGIGGSFYSVDSGDYVNADVFCRYYPRGRALSGLALGGKVGVTHVDGRAYPGVGFDVNWSWVFGKDTRIYLGTGFGLKRLFGTDDTDVLAVLPTLRILNVGIAF